MDNALACQSSVAFFTPSLRYTLLSDGHFFCGGNKEMIGGEGGVVQTDSDKDYTPCVVLAADHAPR